MGQVDFSWDCDASFADHHKIQALADAMKVKLAEAGWALVNLYCRGRRFAPSGDLSKVSPASLAEWAKHKKMSFKALAQAELLDVFDGDLFKETSKKVLHGWPERKYVERDEQRKEFAKASRERAQASRERVKAWRDKQKSERDGNFARERDGNANGNANGNASVRVSVRDDVDVDVVTKVTTETTTTSSATPTPPTSPEPDPTSYKRGEAARRREEQTQILFDRWNVLAHELGLPKADVLSKKRRAGASARIAEGLLDRWNEFVAGLRASPWHLGHNDRGWKANFDWLVQPDRWLAIVERTSAPVDPVLASAGVVARSARRDRESLLDRLAAEFAEPDDPAPTNGGNLP